MLTGSDSAIDFFRPPKHKCPTTCPENYVRNSLSLLRFKTSVIGYARVSTEDRTIDLQKDELKRARRRKTDEEHATGKNTARPQLEACLMSLRGQSPRRRYGGGACGRARARPVGTIAPAKALPRQTSGAVDYFVSEVSQFPKTSTAPPSSHPRITDAPHGLCGHSRPEVCQSLVVDFSERKFPYLESVPLISVFH